MVLPKCMHLLNTTEDAIEAMLTGALIWASKYPVSQKI